MADQFITTADVMRMFSLSKATLMRMRKRGGIPFLRLSDSTIRYRVCDIEAWIKDRSEGQ